MLKEDANATTLEASDFIAAEEGLRAQRIAADEDCRERYGAPLSVCAPVAGAASAAFAETLFKSFVARNGSVAESAEEAAHRVRNVETLRRAARYSIETDESRDSLLTVPGKKTLNTRYMQPGEQFQDVFARVSVTGSDDKTHAERLYYAISNTAFMPATPVLSNLGSPTGLPISCFLNDAPDSMHGIVSTWVENVWLGVNGGGTGSYWGSLRSIGERIGEHNAETSGVMPFLRVCDSLSMAISQGGLRRANNASYLPVWHPEIEEFIEMRRPTGGDPNRKAINLHHGVCIPDEFMEAVRDDAEWPLISPKTGEVIRTISARSLWIRILTARMEQGEPYLLYVGSINKQMPWYQKNFGLTVKTSNLCSEITLPTGLDQYNRMRTAVCCLSSVNIPVAMKLGLWYDRTFWLDIYRFLDNVLTIFLEDAPEDMKNAKYAAFRERSVGLGFMGWHDFLQERNIPFESVEALAWNRKIDNHMRAMADMASYELAKEKGPCPDAADAGVMERFACKLSTAPTASISIIAGSASPGNETISANSFLQKTQAGSMIMRNTRLEKILKRHGQNTDKVWSDITTSKGSVQHLDFLSDREKETYKTAFEVDHVWTIRHAGMRTGVCQSQSTNIFLPADVHKKDLHRIHFRAWLIGLKSMYYCRSLSVQRADAPSRMEAKVEIDLSSADDKRYETCEACQ